LAVACTLGLGCLAGHAQDQPAGVILKTPPPTPSRQVSRDDYRAELTRLQTLVEECRTNAAKCDPEAVGADEEVDKGKFQVHWGWLRRALETGKDEKAKNRLEVLDAAAGRLVDDAADAAASTSPGDLTAQATARRKADEILSHREFRHVQQNSYLDKKLAAFRRIVNKVFEGIGELIPQAPWVATALEWGVLALAATGLLIWVWRVSKQQRVAILESHGGPTPVWQKESDDWAERARAEAERGDWREAVHCLYWSAIVLLEGQKLWRQNRARTPREYVVLLEPGSDKQRALGGLTRVFERIWYGLRPAAESDYQRAAAMLDQLRAR
jgi:hypothetical protein